MAPRLTGGSFRGCTADILLKKPNRGQYIRARGGSGAVVLKDHAGRTVEQRATLVQSLNRANTRLFAGVEWRRLVNGGSKNGEDSTARRRQASAIEGRACHSLRKAASNRRSPWSARLPSPPHTRLTPNSGVWGPATHSLEPTARVAGQACCHRRLRPKRCCTPVRRQRDLASSHSWGFS
jgi:hypothetical protein